MSLNIYTASDKDIGHYYQDVCFVNACHNLNIIPIKSTDTEDMFDHFDYTVNIKSKDYKIEVKAPKRIKRHIKGILQPVQFEYVWLEIKNVRGNPGWLYGKADIIAFGFDTKFVLVDRPELVKVVEPTLNTTFLVENSSSAKNGRCYQRQDRQDLVTLINKDILYSIPHEEWPFDVD